MLFAGLNGVERADKDFTKAQVMTSLTEQGMLIAKELDVTMMAEVISFHNLNRYLFVRFIYCLCLHSSLSLNMFIS